MPSAGFKPAIPAIERLQTYASDRTATRWFLKIILFKDGTNVHGTLNLKLWTIIVCNQWGAGYRWSTQLRHRWYYKVLSCQRYSTVKDDHGTVVESWVAGGNRKMFQKTLPVPLWPPQISHQVNRDWTRSDQPALEGHYVKFFKLILNQITRGTTLLQCIFIYQRSLLCHHKLPATQKVRFVFAEVVRHSSEVSTSVFYQPACPLWFLKRPQFYASTLKLLFHNFVLFPVLLLFFQLLNKNTCLASPSQILKNMTDLHVTSYKHNATGCHYSILLFGHPNNGLIRVGLSHG
jgi:hypothetical protein